MNKSEQTVVLPVNVDLILRKHRMSGRWVGYAAINGEAAARVYPVDNCKSAEAAKNHLIAELQTDESMTGYNLDPDTQRVLEAYASMSNEDPQAIMNVAVRQYVLIRSK